jgi:spermidine dehydrogenase
MPPCLDAAHALRDGARFALAALPVEHEVDLLVIGAGLSGLSAAYFHRQRHPRARLLLLDNQDDFGGHARRCEMRVDGRLILGYGGSESLQSPRSMWGEHALRLLAELNVDLNRLEQCFDHDLYPALGLSRGLLCTREAFGVDKLVTGDPTQMVDDDIPSDRLNARSAADFVRDLPLSTTAREQLAAVYASARDVLAGIPVVDRTRLLASISYRRFLTRHWGLDETAADIFQKRSHDFFAIGIDGVAALDAAMTGYPGFAGLGLEGLHKAKALSEPYIHHFPDGNASLARLLVRRLIPGVAAGTSMEDVVGARFDYTRLDRATSEVRLRLRSTVVAIEPRADGVDVGYVRDGALKRVRARGVIHAGYNMMLPYMMRELGEPQAEALRACVKAPLSYTKVALRDWQPWARAGVHELTNPMGFFSRIKLDYPVSMGGYRFARSPKEPIGAHLVHVPTPRVAGGDQRTAFRRGRAALYATPFEVFERNVVDELTRALGPAGFDAKRDIKAIHVYRWGHGYAYGFNSLYDPPEAKSLAAIAHAPMGAVSIANSDAGWVALAQGAIDEAYRAVHDLES